MLGTTDGGWGAQFRAPTYAHPLTGTLVRVTQGQAGATFVVSALTGWEEGFLKTIACPQEPDWESS